MRQLLRTPLLAPGERGAYLSAYAGLADAHRAEHADVLRTLNAEMAAGGEGAAQELAAWVKAALAGVRHA